MACGDVLSLEDLQTAKKHQIFEAEVLTGKVGGVAGGADIDYATNQVTGQVQKTMPAIMRDFGFEPASFDFTSGGTLGVNDRSKAVLWPLSSGGDGSWYYWEGALPKIVPASSTPASTGGVVDGAWRPVGDITLREDLALNTGGTLVGTSSGKTVEQELQQSGVVRGNDGVKYATSGCAVRRDTALSPDWGPVSDTAHLPINVTSVVGGVDVRVNYVGQKIGTFVAGPDESFARDGALVGGSVAANFANVSIGAPCSFSVDLATSTFEFDTHYFDISRFGLSIGASGNVTITHPSVRTMLNPIIRYVAPNSSSKHLDVFYQTETSPGVTSCFLVGDVEGTISYNGTAWVLGSCDQWVTSDLSFAWNAALGALTVTHPALVGSPELGITQLYLGTPLNVAGSANAGNSFKIHFHKLDGTPAVLGKGLGALFARGKNGIRKTPTGKLLVHLGHVRVNCNHVDYPGGNFWFNAVMQN